MFAEDVQNGAREASEGAKIVEGSFQATEAVVAATESDGAAVAS